jgi:hypothetical protein
VKEEEEEEEISKSTKGRINKIPKTIIEKKLERNPNKKIQKENKEVAEELEELFEEEYEYDDD